MRKEFVWYYLTRAALSALMGWLVFGISWWALVTGLLTFGLFVLYLHSGWFQVDRENPLAPLRRDQRGKEAQRVALIAAVCSGLLLYFLLRLPQIPPGLSQVAGSLALPAGVVVYFATQWVYLAWR